MSTHVDGSVRCKVCRGVIRWRLGSQPEHVFAQDFETPHDGQRTHPVVIETHAPDHTWRPGYDGSPDLMVMADGTVIEHDAVTGFAALSSLLGNIARAVDDALEGRQPSPDTTPTTEGTST